MRNTNQTEYGNLDKRNDLVGPRDGERRDYPKIPHHRVSIQQKTSSPNK